MDKRFSLQWHITDSCDQRCAHCYIFGNHSKCDIDEMKFDTFSIVLNDFLEFCRRIEMKPYIAITGGDPLLHPNIWDFLKLLCDKQIEFSIMGNPFHLCDDTVSRLKKFGCVSYQMSLDGNSEVHDSIRKKGSYATTIDKIKLLNKYNVKSSIMATVSKLNAHSIPDVVSTVVDAKVSVFAFARYCPNEDEKDSMLTAVEYRLFLDEMWNIFSKYRNSNTRFVMKDHLWKLYLLEKGLLDLSQFDEDIIYDGCHCGITHMTVLPNGDVFACRRCNSKVGSVPHDSFYDIFFGDEMETYREYDKFETCVSCELFRFCRGCPAVSKCVNGNFYGKDPQCWHD